MNDQHPHAGYVGDDAYTTGSFDTGGFAADPLFGALPGSYEADPSGQYDATQWGAATAPQWDSASHQDTATGYVEYSEYTGQWDANAWNEAHQANHAHQDVIAADPAHQATGTYDTTGQWTVPGFATGAYDATAWNYAGSETLVPEQYDYPATAAEHEHQPEQAQEFTPEYTSEFPSGFAGTDRFETASGLDDTAHFEAVPDYAASSEAGFDTASEPGPELGTDAGFESGSDQESAPLPGAVPVTPRPVRRSNGNRGRRRTPAKRSALLTVAVPSACVMGVAGIAAASVSGLTDGAAERKDDGKTVTAADPSSVQPVAANNALDTQLAALSADARDFGDRASRTQERIDLKARQEADRKKREAEAARKEALRPKFMLPVKLHQLSARYGQAGVNWMSLHTGIDFPVQYGTPVMAATDGTVRTQWNSAYGNMAIVTAEDGTETWYCHLSSTKIRSGTVKAGDVIAYSGNSGNSTGPHLHFEVRPGGGAAIDPLPWLLGHGLDPTS
ncbi:M23 family metallopeptidase [Streptomyces sp. SP18CS02]|uniref:M23 family metallopeptidase n=1 Tax=Streptomyces sp. SP18CS02 TaxID=3002531 RepID=UPI002E77AE2C|nr:M23 family metallopeptidase [Streptomyces sp. SP18CS02]MEE1756105.1 M23 family metallopeptidase [Streptomyces sp. SP18CS02]